MFQLTANKTALYQFCYSTSHIWNTTLNQFQRRRGLSDGLGCITKCSDYITLYHILVFEWLMAETGWNCFSAFAYYFNMRMNRLRARNNPETFSE